MRTTIIDVKAVLAAGRDYDASPETGDAPSLIPYIDTASAIVDDIVENAADQSITVPTDARLELIERWLSAHFYMMSDQGYASKSTEGASGSFQGQTGKGLAASKYGQTAIELDKTGYLQSLVSEMETNNVKRASMFWAGTTKTAETTFNQRN